MGEIESAEAFARTLQRHQPSTLVSWEDLERTLCWMVMQAEWLATIARGEREESRLGATLRRDYGRRWRCL